MTIRTPLARHAASTCVAALLVAATTIACAPVPGPEAPSLEPPPAVDHPTDSLDGSSPHTTAPDRLELAAPTTTVPLSSTTTPTAPAAPSPQEPDTIEPEPDLGPGPDDQAAALVPESERSRAALVPAPAIAPTADANVPDLNAVRPFAAAQSSGQVVLDRGHVDLVEVTVAGGALVVQVKDDTTPGGTAFWEPADVQARVKDAAKIQVPADPSFAFLGEAGSDLWMLPQVQDPALLWPGWSTERLGPGQVRGDNVTLRLATADGPGSFALFTTNQFGVPTVIFDNDGTAPNSTVIPINTHAHSSWAFGAQGVYRLTFEVSATLQDGTAASTPVTYVYLVGDTTAPVPWDATADPATTVPPSGSGPAATTGATSAGGGTAGPGTATGSNSAGATTGAAAASASVASGAQGALARTGSSPLILLLLASVLVAAGAVARRLSMRLRP
jgi:surface-anchored protein